MTFANAMKFNPQGNPVHAAADSLTRSFECSLRDIVVKYFPELLEQDTDKPIPDRFLLFIALKESAPVSVLSTVTRVVSMDSTNQGSMEMNEDNCSQLATVVEEYAYTTTITDDCSSVEEMKSSAGVLETSSRDDVDDLYFGNDLQRTDSSTGSELTSMWSRRPFNNLNSMQSPAIDAETLTKENESSQHLPFEKPALGQKGMLSLMSEVSKSVERLKEALFVVKLTSPQCDFNEESKSCGEVTAPSKSTKSGSEVVVKRGRGRTPKPPKTISFRLPTDEDGVASTLSHSCQSLLDDLKADTSDPDELIRCHFVETRHNFLEMCQFRHYQFDSLRRAKHSSLMLLYHLHNRDSPQTQPLCSICLSMLKSTRYHCDQCVKYDVCLSCYESSMSSSGVAPHEHLLTPYRIFW